MVWSLPVSSHNASTIVLTTVTASLGGATVKKGLVETTATPTFVQSTPKDVQDTVNAETILVCATPDSVDLIVLP